MVWAWMLQKSNTLEPERPYGMGMDALVTVCSWKPNVIMVWACMLCSWHAVEPERYYGFGMDAR